MDLHPRICQELHLTPQESSGVNAAMSWMDMNPGQLPGRTITASQVGSETKGMPKRYVGGYMDALEDTYTAVVPDPEPTNLQKWKSYCDSLDLSLEPWQVDFMVTRLVADGVAAPEDYDE